MCGMSFFENVECVTHTRHVYHQYQYTHILISEIMLIYTFSLLYCTRSVQVTSTGTFNQNFMQSCKFIYFVLSCPTGIIPYGLRIALLYLLFTNLPTKQ